MDNKRKASGSNGVGAAEDDDRAAKRRKVPAPPSEFDLSKGESPESTTSYGLAFLEQIRRTQDKNGRLVSLYFERLPPKEGNEDYYKRTPLPISLASIERKLNNREFGTMTDLEAYLKRMIANAKEYYGKASQGKGSQGKASQIFEDAERVRKAVSNYMTKTNPAYKRHGGKFGVQATPLPSEPVVEPESEPEDGKETLGAAENHGEDDGEAADEDVEDEQDAEGEADDDAEEEDEEEEDDEDDEEEDEDDDSPPPTSRRGRQSRNQDSRASNSNKTAAQRAGEQDEDEDDGSYDGLSFQQAQEKILDRLINYEKEGDEGWAYYGAFLNLPTRELKDYFKVITDPLSLKGLQKLVVGKLGRKPPTGVSEFKSWAQFEDKTKLLWTNAHTYNEPGSEIYEQATELKAHFYQELENAKAAVQEPPQQKIKLKVASAQETPAPAGPKRITIHVGGSRGSAAASPAPLTAQSASSPVEATPNTATEAKNPTNVASVLLTKLDKTRSASASAASPSPSVGVKQETLNRQSPAVPPRVNGTGPVVAVSTPNGVSTPGQAAAQTPVSALPNGTFHQAVLQPIVPPPPPYETKYRPKERSVADSLLPRLLIRTHPGQGPVEPRFRLDLPAHPKLAQQSLTLTIPGKTTRVQIIPMLNPFLEQQQRQYRLFVSVNGNVLTRAQPTPVPDDPLPIVNPYVFESTLSPGINLIQVHMIAALPKGVKLSSGADCELEKVSIMAHLLRQ